MLSHQDLTIAIKHAQGIADCCHPHFCVVGAQVNINSPTISVWHNGIGSSDTDSQVVHATAILNYPQDRLAEHISKWITALHHRDRVDLNVAR